MNKIVASLGLAAIGASGMQALCADDLGAPTTKIWNVSATLRGFFDDNINTTPSGTNRVGSFGMEIRPGIGLNWAGEATSAKVDYIYALHYYDIKPAGQTLKYSQNHLFDATVQHDFSPRYHVGVKDSFVIGQEPDVLRAPNSPLATPQYISGSNIRNYGSIVFDAEFTPVFSVELNYINAYYNYDDAFNTTQNPGGTVVTPSNSGMLDRIENTPGLEGQWKLKPQTIGLLGYKFGMVNYTADEPITGINGFPATIALSDSRNTRSQYFYLGAIHKFRPELSGSFRGGLQYIDFYNDPNDESDFSPYIVASLQYYYAPESHVDCGFNQSRNTTDVGGSRDIDTSLLYGSMTHRITPKLTGNVIFTFQNSLYNGGANDGSSDQYYQIGLNLRYALTKHFSADMGYNFDKVNSDIAGSGYDRNRVYIGIGANY